jgi:hypothetical protein
MCTSCPIWKIQSSTGSRHRDLSDFSIKRLLFYCKQPGNTRKPRQFSSMDIWRRSSMKQNGCLFQWRQKSGINWMQIVQPHFIQPTRSRQHSTNAPMQTTQKIHVQSPHPAFSIPFWVGGYWPRVEGRAFSCLLQMTFKESHISFAIIPIFHN